MTFPWVLVPVETDFVIVPVEADFGILPIVPGFERAGGEGRRGLCPCALDDVGRGGGRSLLAYFGFWFLQKFSKFPLRRNLYGGLELPDSVEFC